MVPEASDGMFPSAHWSELIVTFADDHNEPLTLDLVATHWPKIAWYPRNHGKMRSWSGARFGLAGEAPMPLPVLPLRVDWGTLRTQASILRTRRD